MKKSPLIPIVIILTGFIITLVVILYPHKLASPTLIEPVVQAPVEFIQPEKNIAELNMDGIPEIWRNKLPEIKKLLIRDVTDSHLDNDWSEMVEVINNPVNKSFVDITGDNIPELKIETFIRPAGGTCYNVLRLNLNGEVKFVTQIDPMDTRFVETNIEGCIIGNGIFGANFELDSKNKAIVSLQFQQSDGISKSACSVTAWKWDAAKEYVFFDKNLSDILTIQECNEMKDFLNGN